MSNPKTKISNSIFRFLDKVFGDGPPVKDPRDESEAYLMISVAERWLEDNGLYPATVTRTLDADKTVDDLIAAERQILVLKAALKDVKKNGADSEAIDRVLAHADRGRA